VYAATVTTGPWPTEWLAEHVPPPAEWGRPGLVLVFSLACAGCVSRALPHLRDMAASHGDALTYAAVHTALGRERAARDELVVALERLRRFARFDLPIGLDLDGAWAGAEGAEGTPHWFAYDRSGARVRSVFGSQGNALTRLAYLVDELLAD
jgi:hypothetical protein